jgi:TfoX/Sxy family transcriptional regulator of competence genes
VGLIKLTFTEEIKDHILKCLEYVELTELHWGNKKQFKKWHEKAVKWVDAQETDR